MNREVCEREERAKGNDLGNQVKSIIMHPILNTQTMNVI